VDRCALFVDAGYMLADGAMAAHGTSHRESVSWDYAGLLKFLASLAADRTGLPLLRCYWYEATVEGRRTPEHDTLADLSGLKLRLGRMRPGKREGVETEIHRDLTTLARNRAVSDALLVSAEEDLAQVIADVQDLGVRVIIVHISVDGNWTVSRSLRQQCDDIVEIDGAQLRPYVELIVGAEPSGYGEQYTAAAYGGRALTNGHTAGLGAGGSHPALLAGAPGSHPAPPAIYTAPVVADYRGPSHQATGSPGGQPGQAAPAPPPEPVPAGLPEGNGRVVHGAHAASGPAVQAPQGVMAPPGPPLYSAPAPTSFRAEPAMPAIQEVPQPQAQGATPGNSSVPGQSGPSGPMQAHPGPPSSGSSGPLAAPQSSPYEPAHPGAFADPAGQFSPAPPEQFSGVPAGLPARRSPQDPGPQQPGQPLPLPPRQPPAPHPQPAGRPGPPAGAGFVPPQSPYSAAAPGSSPAAPLSLGDAVQTAHAEGFEFGESVAREAPALWLEAVLARKPRMPSDLEARLLQGSALPIDSLLHDEVRHALRRGFWDALERSRR
jgi:uncharacterized LabA/DUF88 family protein